MSGDKWQIGPVKLANGEEARIDAVNEGQEDYRYTGRIRGSSGQWIAAGWHANGRYVYANTDHGLNLAPPPKKTVRVKLWINVYLDGEHCMHRTEESALAGGEHARFALIEIDREVTEGEGL
jgi:hypothetical protein